MEYRSTWNLKKNKKIILGKVGAERRKKIKLQRIASLLTITRRDKLASFSLQMPSIPLIDLELEKVSRSTVARDPILTLYRQGISSHVRGV